jgi:GNAT superfamily N-acetyltransferase
VRHDRPGPVGDRRPGPAPVRAARPDEHVRLRAIELEADDLYLTVGIGPFPEDDVHDRLDEMAVVFAAGDPAVGFVSVEVLDGDAHIDQLSVLAAHGGRGTGRALLDRAIRWARDAGLAGVTLTTFRDVPWNAPIYQRVGFEVVTDPPPGLAARRADERAEGFDRFGPRVAMRLAL